MFQSNSCSWQIRFLSLGVTWMVLAWLVLAHGTSPAEAAPPAPPPLADSDVPSSVPRRDRAPIEAPVEATDQPTYQSPWRTEPEDLETEALRLRDLRGSIVPPQFGEPVTPTSPHAPPPPNHPTWSPHREVQRAAIPWSGRPPQGYDGSRASPVDVLRESAAQLDAAANRLESYELYHQADALRSAAQKLRIDARRM